MQPSSITVADIQVAPAPARSSVRRPLFLLLAITALVYAALAGLRTVSDSDLFWQLSTGRWVANAHRTFSSDVFSYTAAGQPWIYPAGSGLVFYGLFRVGGYELLSWLGAAVCVGVIALLLHRGSAFSAALAVVAVPLIYSRTNPRADMFSVLLFSALLAILWEYHQERSVPLWSLPLLMVAWSNLHLGFLVGWLLVACYVLSEVMLLPDASRRRAAVQRLRVALPWLLASGLATLLNPWGWRIYQAVLRQQEVMKVHSVQIQEWAPFRFTWSSLQQALYVRDPYSCGMWIVLAATACFIIALLRRQWGAALFLLGPTWMAISHIRFLAILACTVVLVGGWVLDSAWGWLSLRLAVRRVYSVLGVGIVFHLVLLAGVRSWDLVDNHFYLSHDDQIGSFGTGLSDWFPERAAGFIVRQKLPANIFHSYEQGGFATWQLGPRYKDYADGRAIPFGPEVFKRLQQLFDSDPDSLVWQNEANLYGIHTVLLPLERRAGIRKSASILPKFCNSPTWGLVYMDEVSAVFMRRSAETDAVIAQAGLDCDTVPLPAAETAASFDRSREFNRWANAAGVLITLGRLPESIVASRRALQLFDGNAWVWFNLGFAEFLTGQGAIAERDLLRSTELMETLAAWRVLADMYSSEGRPVDAANALARRAALQHDLSPAQ